jgi:hypothetical protein
LPNGASPERRRPRTTTALLDWLGIPGSFSLQRRVSKKEVVSFASVKESSTQAAKQ